MFGKGLELHLAKQKKKETEARGNIKQKTDVCRREKCIEKENVCFEEACDELHVEPPLQNGP